MKKTNGEEKRGDAGKNQTFRDAAKRQRQASNHPKSDNYEINDTMELGCRIERLETLVASLQNERQTFVRHQQTLGRHLRRCLNDNRQLRIDNRMLINYIESVSTP